MTHGLNDVARSGLALRANHGRALADASQGFSQVSRAAHERDSEAVLVDVVVLVGGREHFGLVNVVDFEGFKNLGLDEVTDAALCHDWNRDGFFDFDDLGGIGHAGYAAVLANIGRHSLKRHYSACAGVLGDPGLLGGHDVHDDAALEHLRQSRLGYPSTRLGQCVDGHVSASLRLLVYELEHSLYIRRKT